MKNLLIVLLVVGNLFAATVYRAKNLAPDARPTVVELKDGYINEFMMDATLDQGAATDTAWTRVYDIGKHPFNTRSDTTGVVDLKMGDIAVSCYDDANDAGADSVNVRAVLYVSGYAADGINPNSAFSDVWTATDSISVNNLSENGTMIEGSQAIVTVVAARYYKLKMFNRSSGANNNDARCRVYWTKKARI